MNYGKHRRMDLYENMKHRIQSVTHSQYSVHLLDAIFRRPIFRSADVTRQLKLEANIHEKTLPGLIKKLREAEILKEIQPASGRRSAVLYFPELIRLVERRPVF